VTAWGPDIKNAHETPTRGSRNFMLVVLHSAAIGFLGLSVVGNLFALFYLSSKNTTNGITFARVVQFLGHFASFLMSGFRLTYLLYGELTTPIWVASAFSISSFFYYLFSNVYYLELLKALCFRSKFIKPNYVFYLQIGIAISVFLFNGATLFRYIVYVDASSNNWASKVTIVQLVGRIECHYDRANCCGRFCSGRLRFPNNLGCRSQNALV
jgi:hypothetical protein